MKTITVSIAQDAAALTPRALPIVQEALLSIGQRELHHAIGMAILQVPGAAYIDCGHDRVRADMDLCTRRQRWASAHMALPCERSFGQQSTLWWVTSDRVESILADPTDGLEDLPSTTPDTGLILFEQPLWVSDAAVCDADQEGIKGAIADAFVHDTHALLQQMSSQDIEHVIRLVQESVEEQQPTGGRSEVDAVMIAGFVWTTTDDVIHLIPVLRLSATHPLDLTLAFPDPASPTHVMWIDEDKAYVAAYTQAVADEMVRIFSAIMNARAVQAQRDVRSVELPRKRRRQPRAKRDVVLVSMKPADVREHPVSIRGGSKHAVRYVVRGHWRNQACGPGRQEHRRTWISTHIRGPEDQPLRPAAPVVRIIRGHPSERVTA